MECEVFFMYEYSIVWPICFTKYSCFEIPQFYKKKSQFLVIQLWHNALRFLSFHQNEKYKKFQENCNSGFTLCAAYVLREQKKSFEILYTRNKNEGYGWCLQKKLEKHVIPRRNERKRYSFFDGKRSRKKSEVRWRI